jgi:hypothetical protein
MFSALHSYLSSFKQNAEIEKAKARKNFELMVDKLVENDDEKEETRSETDNTSDKIAELSWGCTKNEGTRS